MNKYVQVLDIDIGNISSVIKMLTRIGADVKILRTFSKMNKNSPIILPGVGNFSSAVKKIDYWREEINYLYNLNHPILGICLGAQLMCQSSEEGFGAGLGWVNIRVRKFPLIDNAHRLLRVPHMEWRNFTPPEGCLPFPCSAGRMYYAHSFFIEPNSDAVIHPYLVEYGGVRFASIIKSKRAIGVQFHPEKSHQHGMSFLRSWFKWASNSL